LNPDLIGELADICEMADAYAESVQELVLDADEIRDGAGEILGRIAVDVLATTGALLPRSVMGSPRPVIIFKTRVKSCSVRNFS
jgi:hypothetical protein